MGSVTNAKVNINHAPLAGETLIAINELTLFDGMNHRLRSRPIVVAAADAPPYNWIDRCGKSVVAPTRSGEAFREREDVFSKPSIRWTLLAEQLSLNCASARSFELNYIGRDIVRLKITDSASGSSARFASEN